MKRCTKVLCACLLIAILLTALILLKHFSLHYYAFEGSSLLVDDVSYEFTENYISSAPGKAIGRCEWGTICVVKGNTNNMFLYIKEQPFCERLRLLQRNDIDVDKLFLEAACMVKAEAYMCESKNVISNIAMAYQSDGITIQEKKIVGSILLTLSAYNYPNVQMILKAVQTEHGWFLETKNGRWCKLEQEFEDWVNKTYPEELPKVTVPSGE